MSKDNYGLDPDRPTRNARCAAPMPTAMSTRRSNSRRHRQPAARGVPAHHAAVRERAAALLARARARRVGSGSPSATTPRSTTPRARWPRSRASAIPGTPSRTTAAGATSRPAASNRLAAARPAAGPTWTPRERARAHIDLALVSVLLDAGAGADWHYVEAATGKRFTRSEGLARRQLPCLHQRPVLLRPRPPAAGRRRRPARPGDRPARRRLPGQRGNPLVGLAGRATLLRRLGEAMREQPDDVRRRRPARRPVRRAGQPLRPDAPPTAEVTAHEILLAAARHRSRASGRPPTRSTASRPTAAMRPAASARATRRSRWATAGATRGARARA